MGRIIRIWRLATGTGHVAAACILGLLVSAALFVYANELEPRAGGQPEILASTSTFYPAGWQILAIDPTTGEFRNVSNLLTADSWLPAWSPGGDEIAFDSDRTGLRQIFVMRCNGKHVRQLTNDASTHRSPAFSPDGSQIAFWSDQDGLQNIYVMDADGSNLHQLTRGSQNTDPSWSPDGSRIVFVSNRDNPLRWLVYTMDPDGSNVANLGAVAQSLQPRPVFSPDGSQIAFASTGTNFTGISVMSPDGTNVENLTPGRPFVARYAVWSLDGRTIALQGSPDPGHGQPFRVYLIDVGTRELRQLTDFSAEPHAWAWFPK